MSHNSREHLSEGQTFDRNVSQEGRVPLNPVQSHDHRQREHRRLFEQLHQSHLRLKAEIAARIKTEEKLREVNSQLEAAVEELAQLAARDRLTGVANRAKFEEVFEKEWNRCLRNVKPISLILIDVDLFKQYNDAHGHLAGDECLKLVAQSVRLGSRRPGDLIARYGGEEFAVLLPETSLGAAFQLAEKMRYSVECEKLPHGESPKFQHVTISVGISTMQPRKYLDRSILLATADLALSEAKKYGRNRIVVSPASVA
jgi:diguanylate cyclase (GGDEF)-like protein